MKKYLQSHQLYVYPRVLTEQEKKEDAIETY